MSHLCLCLRCFFSLEYRYVFSIYWNFIQPSKFGLHIHLTSVPQSELTLASSVLPSTFALKAGLNFHSTLIRTQLYLCVFSHEFCEHTSFVLDIFINLRAHSIALCMHSVWKNEQINPAFKEQRSGLPVSFWGTSFQSLISPGRSLALLGEHYLTSLGPTFWSQILHFVRTSTRPSRKETELCSLAFDLSWFVLE